MGDAITALVLIFLIGPIIYQFDSYRRIRKKELKLKRKIIYRRVFLIYLAGFGLMVLKAVLTDGGVDGGLIMVLLPIFFGFIVLISYIIHIVDYLFNRGVYDQIEESKF
ncbi:MAG: hypothetical protein NTU44_04680 [Bacteroidetes bacterium]|nr:hypothetical protein [Bacteroidota bacterium]